MEFDRRPGPGVDIIRDVNDRLPEYLSLEALDRTILTAFAEDLGEGDGSVDLEIENVNLQSGDLTTIWTVPASAEGSGRLEAKQNGVLAGTVVATRVFQLFDNNLRIDWLYGDRDSVRDGDLLARIHGALRSILTAERTALNFLQRMSGIATAARAFADLLEGTGTRILDTRKTAPGLRLLDKWAVIIGGGVNHRLGLFDEVLIKENHIAAAGGLSKALQQIRVGEQLHSGVPGGSRNPRVRVVVEVSSLDQIREILTLGGVDRLLLDNMVDVREGVSPDVSRLLAAVKLIDGRILTEASGNITLETARVIAETGVDFVSIGALTHSVTALDLSILIEPVISP